MTGRPEPPAAGPQDITADSEVALAPYAPRLATEWLETSPGLAVRVLEGTLAFVDISGFTRLTEILAGRGKAGAEEMTGYLDSTFTALLGIAYPNGGELVKWGGDAVLLWYTGDGHAERAVETAWQMQRTMARIGRLRTSAGKATLRMSVGIHSGEFHFFSVGAHHRELIVTGPSATRTAHLEAVAEAGEIVVSPETAALIAPEAVGEPKEDGLLVRAPPPVSSVPVRPNGPAGPAAPCLPAPLRTFLAAAPIESEHRQVSVAFVEFSGVDDLLGSAGEDGVAAALERFLTDVQRACADRHVTFWETDIAEDGGKVMLVAGAPSANDDDAGAILATVRDIVDSADRLRLRAGVNCGRVFTGGFGPPFRRTYSAKGDAINLAARLMGRALPGQVIASVEVVERSRVPFRTEPMEPFTVKGKVHPVHAERVLAALAGRRSASRRHPASRPRPAMVGRDEELGSLVDRLHSAAAGRGSCVQLVGGPGMGKSRLVEEVESRADGFRMLGVVCEQYGSVTPYASIRTLLRQVLGIEAGAGPAESGERLRAEVTRVAPPLLPWIPLLAPVVGADATPTPEASALEDGFRQERLADTLLQLLAGLLDGPVLLVVEDAQWTDEASAALLRHLAGAAPTLPWFVLVAGRPSSTGDRIGDMPEGSRLELGPLPGEAVVALIRSATADHPLVPHQRDTVAARCGGNPLFLLELIDAGLQSGFDSAMPDSVEGVFAAQIDRLEPRDRRILRFASVLGVQLPLDLLEEMAAEPLDLSGLGDFLDREGADSLRFRHNMLRDAAYEGLSYARRRQLHALAGEALERRSGREGAEESGLLAVHFAHAGQHRKAWRYARAAGCRARDLHAPAEAETFFGRALQAGRAAGDLAPEDLLEVAEALGDARTHLGQFAAADAAYREARRWAVAGPARARLQYKAAVATDRAGRYRHALQMLTRAERTLDREEPTSAVTRQRAEIRAQYGLIRHRQGRGDEAVRLLREAVWLATDAEAPDVLATALLYLDIAELTAGVAGDGAHARRALEIQRQVGDNPWLEARALNQLGIRAYFAGRWPEAVSRYADSRDACERAGDRWTAALESANIAEVMADQGHLTEAEVMLEDALETCRAAGTRTFIADGTRMLGRLASRRGDPELSSQRLAEAREIYVSDGEALQVCLTDAILAETHLRAGCLGAAADLARQVADRVAGLPGRHMVLPLAQRVLAISVRAGGGDPEEGRRALEASIDVARRHHSRYELALSLQALSDGWPDRVGDTEQAERDALFGELGIVESARHLGPASYQNIGSPEKPAPA